ncbi:MAG: NERD domain-containing protein [Betaproteobacteria bacterium]|nr:NERD domain-containing protein [Betaproteobacteria bacterium]
MELTSLFIATLKPLLWLLPLLIVVAILKRPWFKGTMGERRVKRLIGRQLNPSIYREFSNVTVQTDDGTTQIDHIYVCPFGVLVIETKNMSGWIFGGRNQAQWTQTIYRKKVKFQNPLRQNYRHIKALESLLDLPTECFKSIVVFAGNCTLKTEMPDEVCRTSDLIKYIYSIDARIFSDAQVDDICNKIISFRLEPTRQVHRDHVENLKRRHRA